MFKVECACEKCRSTIAPGGDTYCYWCYDELKSSLAQAVQQVSELREIVKVLEDAARERVGHAKSH